jgi:hypothetical protein
LPLEPVLLLLVRLEEEVECPYEMMAAKSWYVAWESRGSWPKRLKAHGAVVDVGNREKEDDAMLGDDEDDIYYSGLAG